MSDEIRTTTDQDFARLRLEASDWLGSHLGNGMSGAPSLSPSQWVELCKTVAVFADREAQRRIIQLRDMLCDIASPDKGEVG